MTKVLPYLTIKEQLSCIFILFEDEKFLNIRKQIYENVLRSKDINFSIKEKLLLWGKIVQLDKSKEKYQEINKKRTDDENNESLVKF
jgi:hypothetical protein